MGELRRFVPGFVRAFFGEWARIMWREPADLPPVVFFACAVGAFVVAVLVGIAAGLLK